MTQTLPRLLVVYKKSQLELYQEHQPETLERLVVAEPKLWERFLRAHAENADAILRVRQAVLERQLEASFVYRADRVAASGYDLVVSVGGDGTLLDVSHSVLDRPLLGINSSPELSVGNFCAATAAAFGDALDAWRRGELTATALTRLELVVNGEVVPTPVLNEVLLAHTVPAAVSRYVLTHGDVEEEQKSSGLWISTAAGSTAAIHSAGGDAMAPTDPRIQYLVREPYVWPGHHYRLLRGYVDGELELLSKMRTAAIYIDGYREQVDLTLGDRVRIRRHPNPLNLVGFRQQLPATD